MQTQKFHTHPSTKHADTVELINSPHFIRFYCMTNNCNASQTWTKNQIDVKGIYLFHSIYQQKEPLHVAQMGQNQNPSRQVSESAVPKRRFIPTTQMVKADNMKVQSKKDR